MGSHLLPRLREQGDVTLLNRRGNAHEVTGVHVVDGDVTDASSLPRLDGFDVVYHMAAVSYLPEAVKNPAEAFWVNATGTLNLLEAARDARPTPRFVYLSSGHVYGPARYSPIDERHPLEPNNPYGASKLAGDRLVKAYHDTYGLPTVTLRVFNVYGPGQARHFVVPSMIDQLKLGRAPSLGNGRAVRDFTFVSDFMDALLLAGRSKEAVGEVFNVGTGTGHSVEAIANQLTAIAGVRGTPTFDASRAPPGDIPELVVDARKIRTVLGWSPKVAMDDGLRRTWLAEARRAPPSAIT